MKNLILEVETKKLYEQISCERDKLENLSFLSKENFNKILTRKNEQFALF